MRKHLALAAFTLLVCLIGAELLCFVALQVITREGFNRGSIQARLADTRTLEAGGNPAAFLLHPYLGYVANPEVPNVVSGQMNRYGLTGPDPLEASEDAYVVAITGGSLAGLQASTFVDGLRKALRNAPAVAGRELVIVNLAMAGYKQPQQLLSLQFFWTLGARFDAVINLDGFNDVALPFSDAASKGVVGHFPRNWNLLAGGAMDAIPESTLHQILGIRASLRGWQARLGSLSWSNLSLVLWDVLERKQRKKMQKLQASALGGGALPFGLAGPEGFPRDFDGVLSEALAVWERSSLLMHQACQARGVAYTHLLQPNQYVAGSKPLSDWEKTNAVRQDQPYRPGAVAGYPKLLEAGKRLRAAGVDFRDLTHLFKTEAETVYVDDCCHLNERGAEVVSEAMAEALRSRHP